MTPDIVVVARIAGSYGVKGWVHVRSFTDPPENLLHYTRWRVRAAAQSDWAPVGEVHLKRHKKGVIAKLEGVDTPEQAGELRGAWIGIRAQDLPDLGSQDEYYWRDLVGCEVFNTQADALGQVSHLLETGAHDVLCVRTGNNKDAQAELLVPFSAQHVIEVDLARRVIIVDWQRDWT